MKDRIRILYLILVIILVSFSCTKETLQPVYLTENVIVIVIDGARYSETWGDSSHQYIPELSNLLSSDGIVNTEFYNNGSTKTTAGHTGITTGFYQVIDNAGNEIPRYPSFFQYWNAKNANSGESWIITSKDKLEVLGNCQSSDYSNQYMPNTDCGISGLGSGYRHDSITYNHVIQIMNDSHPKLILVNFREPDYSGHSGDWNKYLEGIKSSDKYASQIWKFIQEDSFYKDKTTLFITNDHGRHLDEVSNGFVSHGDNCLGCRHISLFAFGPDFKKGMILDQKREIVDISATISELLQLNMEYSQGEIMHELFK